MSDLDTISTKLDALIGQMSQMREHSRGLARELDLMNAEPGTLAESVSALCQSFTRFARETDQRYLELKHQLNDIALSTEITQNYVSWMAQELGWGERQNDEI